VGWRKKEWADFVGRGKKKIFCRFCRSAGDIFGFCWDLGDHERHHQKNIRTGFFGWLFLPAQAGRFLACPTNPKIRIKNKNKQTNKQTNKPPSSRSLSLSSSSVLVVVGLFLFLVGLLPLFFLFSLLPVVLLVLLRFTFLFFSFFMWNCHYCTHTISINGRHAWR